MPKGTGYGAWDESAKKSLIKTSTQAGIKKGILELGASLRTADTVRSNKKKFTQPNPSQAMFNKMGMKLYGSHIKSLYEKSGFKKPTGQQLVAGFNKAKNTAEKMAKNAKAFQGPTGQSLISSYSDMMTNTQRLTNTTPKIKGAYTTKNKQPWDTSKHNLPKFDKKNKQWKLDGEWQGSGPKSSTGKVTTHTTKAGDLEGYYAKMRQLHKKHGIKVKDKSKYRAYQGY